MGNVLEPLETVGDVLWHRHVHVSFVVISLQGEAAVIFSVPIFSYFIMSFEALNKVVSIGFCEVFHAKVVDTDTEFRGSSVVLPHTNRSFYWLVTVL